MVSKINEDFTEFYEQIKSSIMEHKYEEKKDLLIEFISNHPGEIKAITFYLECLLELKQFDELDSFIDSLEDESLDNADVNNDVFNKIITICTNDE